MARWSLFALLVAALAGLTQSKPLAQDSLKDSNAIHTAESWAYSNCGESGAFHGVVEHAIESYGPPGGPTDVVNIQSLTVSPDPPKPGQNLTVHVSAYVSQVIEVSHASPR